MPDPTEVVQAASANGWTAVAVAFVLVLSFGALGWLVRTWHTGTIEREKGMVADIHGLQEFQQQKLTDLVVNCTKALEQNSAAVDRFTEVLRVRPCIARGKDQEPPV